MSSFFHSSLALVAFLFSGLGNTVLAEVTKPGSSVHERCHDDLSTLLPGFTVACLDHDRPIVWISRPRPDVVRIDGETVNVSRVGGNFVETPIAFPDGLEASNVGGFEAMTPSTFVFAFDDGSLAVWQDGRNRLLETSGVTLLARAASGRIFYGHVADSAAGGVHSLKALTPALEPSSLWESRDLELFLIRTWEGDRVAIYVRDETGAVSILAPSETGQSWVPVEELEN